MASNKSGRPTKNTIIKFSQQPLSLVSRLLIKLKDAEYHIETYDVDVECSSNQIQTESEESLESASNDDEVVDIQQEDNYILCQDCSHRSKTIREHKKHEKMHKEDKQFACDFPNCAYTSKFSCNLSRHKRIHTSEKPYLCDQCPFRSNFVNSLKVHKRIHTDERPFICMYCNYRCNSSSNLKKHCKSRHFYYK